MKRWSVDDVMTRDVASVTTGATYREVVNLLADKGISAVPVVDDQGRVLGVVSEADLLHKVEFTGESQPPKTFEGRRTRHARVKSAADRAGDLMTSPAVTTTAQTSLAEAAKLMDANDIKRLPVLDAAGRLVGIVSRTDLLRFYVRTDEQIRQDIERGVLAHTLWIDPDALDVRVTSGVVRLRGKVDRKSTAALIAQLSAAVAGVTDLQDELTWEFDDSDISDPAYYRSHPFSGPPQ